MGTSRLGAWLKAIFAVYLTMLCVATVLLAPCPAKAAQPSPVGAPDKKDFQRQVDAEILRMDRIIRALEGEDLPPFPSDETPPAPQATPDKKPPAVHAKEAETLYARALQHLDGKGVPKDAAKAAGYFRQAADMGHARAQTFLGMCYDEGVGVPQDYREAVKWYKKAAEQGDAKAQYNLGLCYDNGEGVPQDRREAVKWYTKAAEQGVAKAQYNNQPVNPRLCLGTRKV